MLKRTRAKLLVARENANDRVTVGISFLSDWFKRAARGLERFSIECRQTKTKATTTAN